MRPSAAWLIPFRRCLAGAAAGLALVIGAAAPAEAREAAPADVRVVGNGDPSRVTLWSETAFEATAELSADSLGYRIVVTPAERGSSTTEAEPVDPVTGVASYAWKDGRLHLDLSQPMMIARVITLPPAGVEPRHRYILDLNRVSAARYEAAVSADAPVLQRVKARGHPSATPSHKGDRLERYTIVIDAGHGGKDPGAIAVTGVREKDIVLAAARELRDLLERDPRFDVKLTRETDVYIPLEDRVTKARNWGADLFISLHADAAGSPDVQGASVYTISARGEARIDREAARNDWEMPLETGAPKDVNTILEDLIKRETKTNSGLFARMLIPELEKAGPALRNTHRNAGFYVLLAPDVPAVLVEIGFLTNRADALRLQSRGGRARAMQAVDRAIRTYFDRQEARLASN